ncbi:Glycosidase [Cohnella sp. OV330]|nr:Glycosidase [Cohnella sp. OV330]
MQGETGADAGERGAAVRKLRRIVTAAAAVGALGSLLVSCSTVKTEDAKGPSGVYYEIFVRSFADSNGDGIGDIKGIEQKLDYLEELGVDGLWLTPIQPSPSYHGYDVTDYYGINPQFGTMDDYKSLLAAAHKHGMKVLMDLVVNHTSAEHPWFAASASGKDDAHRNWYTWAEDRGLSTSAMSATGGEAWHAVGGGDHYLGTFWSGMPDLNFDEPAVRAEMIKIGNYWLDQGVDGFRLDAAKHVYEDFKSQANSPAVAKKNQAWWQEFRRGLTAKHPDVYLVGEVWSSAGAIVPYVKNALDSTFDFDLSDWIRDAAAKGTASDMPSRLERTSEIFARESGGKYIDAPFLDNHDRDRFMSLAGGDVAKGKLAAAMLLTMPGRPFVYYGEEFGMQGAGADERKREPMRWTKSGADPDSSQAGEGRTNAGEGQSNAGKGGAIREPSEAGTGQTRWEPSVANTDPAVSVEAQDGEAGSMLSRYRELIALRGQSAALRDGAIVPVAAEPPAGTVAFIRATAEERVYVAHNLTAEPKTIALDAESAKAYRKLWYASESGAGLKEGTITLPAYGTVILK